MTHRVVGLMFSPRIIFRATNSLNYSAANVRQFGFLFGKKAETICDLKQQSIILEDGARKVAYLKDAPLKEAAHPECTTTYKCYRYGARKADNDMLGQRVMVNGELVWKWMKYWEAIEKCDHVSQALRAIGIGIGEETRIGIYSRNRPEWILTDMAAHNFSNCTVPLYDTVSLDDLIYITNLTELPIMFVDGEVKTKKLLQNIDKMSTLKYIIQYDQVSAEQRDEAKKAGVDIWWYEDFERMGREIAPEKRAKHVEPQPDTLATISFTSGTTGRPKGVMLTHKNFCSVIVSAHEFVFLNDGTDGHLCYLPLAHIYERVSSLVNLTNSCKLGFFRGEVQHIVEDAQSLAPSLLPVVPRVVDKIHKGVLRQVQGKPVKKAILKLAIAYKNLHYRYTRRATRDTWVDKFVLAKIQNLLGPNMKQIIIGAAKPDLATMRFIRGAFGCYLFEGYGQTETTGPTTIQIRGDTREGVCGPPMSCCQIKLLDVPALGYYADKNGGEIAIKGHNVTRGYFKNPEATRDAFTDDGYLRTGDIGRFHADGSMEVIDRIKNVFKLPQGKFVAPEHIESLYSSSRFVAQIYVHGDMQKPWLVAVVVPDPVILLAYAERKYQMRGVTIEDVCKDERIIADVKRKLIKMTEDNEQPRYEGIYAVHLTTTGFSADNDLATPTLKNKRNKIAKYFEKEIAEMYEKIEKEEMNTN